MNKRIIMALLIGAVLGIALVMPAKSFAATIYYSSPGNNSSQYYNNSFYSNSPGTIYYYNNNPSGKSTYYYNGTLYSNSANGTYYYNSGNTWYYYSSNGSYTPSRPSPTPVPQPSPRPTPQPEPTPSPGLTVNEQRMVNLINQERSKAGLPPLTVDLRLVDLARKKSQDMITNNYFSHTSPVYGDPFKMMTSAGINYRIAGENLAGAGTVDQAHSALMNSAGHRQNILNPSYDKVGVGIAAGGGYGNMYTQLFIGTW